MSRKLMCRPGTKHSSIWTNRLSLGCASPSEIFPARYLAYAVPAISPWSFCRNGRGRLKWINFRR